MFIDLGYVQPRKQEWVWRERIPRGEISLVEGNPGTNKSTLTLDLAARISTGRTMPDGSEGIKGGVLLLQTEDSIAKTLVPRLDAAGADRSRISVTDRLLAIPDDVTAVEKEVVRMQAKLLVIDPLSAFLGRSVNNDQSVRQALEPLATLAERHGVAVVAVRHLNKSQGQRAMYRGLGSIGIVAVARSQFACGPSPKDSNLRVLAHSKSTGSPLAPSLLYEPVAAENGAVRIEWYGECDYSVDAILAPPQGDAQRPREEAVQFLLEALAHGSVPQKHIQDKARDCHLAWRTVERAKRELNVVSSRIGFGRGSVVHWSLSSPDHSPPEQEVAGYDDNAHTLPMVSVAVYGEPAAEKTGNPQDGEAEHKSPTPDVAVYGGPGISPTSTPVLSTESSASAEPETGKHSGEQPTQHQKATKKTARSTAAFVKTVLARNNGQTLSQITKSVLAAGYEPTTEDACTAVQKSLQRLIKNGTVTKHEKQYYLASTDNRNQTAPESSVRKAEPPQGVAEEMGGDTAATRRKESLDSVRRRMVDVTEIMITVSPSIRSACSGDLGDIVKNVLNAAERILWLLELDPPEIPNITAPANDHDTDTIRQRLDHIENLLKSVVAELDALKLTDTDRDQLRSEGQKMLNAAAALGESLGIPHSLLD
jgi:hypothetical protein